MARRVASLRARLLATLVMLLLVASLVAAVGLDALFRDLGLRARQEVLEAQVIALIGSADLDEAGMLRPESLAEARLAAPGSGLYAEILGTGEAPDWRSPSTLGSGLALQARPPPGERVFERTRLSDNTRILGLSLGIRWTSADGTESDFVLRAAESLEPYYAQVAQVRAALAAGAFLLALTLLGGLALALRFALRPLERMESEILAIEAGQISLLGGEWPRELAGVTGNLNALLAGERRRLERSRTALDNLAHSLKTPLAAMRSLLESAGEAERQSLLPQLDRMQAIVQHQLKRAVFSGAGATLTDLQVQEPLEQLRGALAKVYADKNVVCTLRIAAGAAYPIDAGDLMELAGNLMDNAYKYCHRQVAVRATPWTSADWRRAGLVLDVEDDGRGIPPQERARVQERGARADETMAGQGIGLAVSREIAAAHSGTIEIGESALGGARLSVRLPGR